MSLRRCMGQCGWVGEDLARRGHRSACGYIPELVRRVSRMGWAGAGQDTAQPRAARCQGGEVLAAGELSLIFIHFMVCPLLPAPRAKRGRVHPTVPRVERNRPHYAPGPVPGVRPKRGWHHRLLRAVRCKLTNTLRGAHTHTALGRDRVCACTRQTVRIRQNQGSVYSTLPWSKRRKSIFAHLFPTVQRSSAGQVGRHHGPV